MEIKDYFNEDILREISQDKKRLKDVAKRDNGFILKQFEKFNIPVTRDFIEDINTAASVVYLFNHFTLTEEEKVKYSVNFKDNSLIMKSITDKSNTSLQGTLTMLVREDLPFINPGSLLTFSELHVSLNKIKKMDFGSSDKRDFIISSMEALPFSDLVRLDDVMFKKFPEIFEKRFNDLFKEDRFVNIYKELDPSSGVDTVLSYLKETGDIEGLSFIDDSTFNGGNQLGLSVSFLKEAYQILKEKDPSITTTSMFFNAINSHKKVLLVEDISNDFNQKKVSDFLFNSPNLMESLWRFEDLNSPFFKTLSPKIKKFMNLLSFNSEKIAIGKLIELLNENNGVPVSQITNIAYAINTGFRELGGKQRDFDGKVLGVYEKDELTELVKLFYSRACLDNAYSYINIDSQVFDIIKKDVPQSLNKFFILSNVVFNNSTLDEKEKNKLIKELGSGLDEKQTTAILDFITGKVPYTEDSYVASLDWKGGIKNLPRDLDGKILWNEFSLGLFESMHPNFIIETVVSNKASVSVDVFKYISDLDVDSFSETQLKILKYWNEKENISLGEKRVVQTLRGNEDFYENLLDMFSDLPEPKKSENEIVMEALEIYQRALLFVNKNTSYCEWLNSLDDHSNVVKENNRYIQYSAIDRAVLKISKQLKSLDPKYINNLKKMINPQKYNEALAIDWVYPSFNQKEVYFIKGLNDGSVTSNNISKNITDQYIKYWGYHQEMKVNDKLKSLWEQLNDKGKLEFFHASANNSYNERFYELMLLINYNDPQTNIEKECKDLILSKFSHKVLSSEHVFKNICPNANIKDIYPLLSKIAEQNKWGYTERVNKGFDDLLSCVLENSSFSDYLECLESAKLSSPSLYVRLLLPNKIYNQSVSFKDYKSSDLKELPGYVSFNKFVQADYDENYPQNVKYNYNDERQDVHFVGYWYSQMDLNVIADGIDEMRKHLIDPVINDFDKKGYSENSINWDSVTNILQIPIYIDEIVRREKIDNDDYLPTEWQMKLFKNLFDNLIDKDIANFNLLRKNTNFLSYLDENYIIQKISENINSVEDVIKFFGTEVSSNFDKDGDLVSQGFDELSNYSNQEHYAQKKNVSILNGVISNFLMNEENAAALSYQLSFAQTHDSNFVKLPLVGSFNLLESLVKDIPKYRSLSGLKDYSDEVIMMAEKKSLIEKTFEGFVESPDNDDYSSMGFKL